MPAAVSPHVRPYRRSSKSGPLALWRVLLNGATRMRLGTLTGLRRIGRSGAFRTCRHGRPLSSFQPPVTAPASGHLGPCFSGNVRAGDRSRSLSSRAAMGTGVAEVDRGAEGLGNREVPGHLGPLIPGNRPRGNPAGRPAIRVFQRVARGVAAARRMVQPANDTGRGLSTTYRSLAVGL
jgi:hypothetical protein